MTPSRSGFLQTLQKSIIGYACTLAPPMEKEPICFIAIDLPITSKEIAIVLGIEPYRIVSDLMRNGVFANYYTEITDEKIIKETGVRHGVRFRIRT